MNEHLELLVRVVLIGAGGAAFIDVWSLVLRRVFHIATLDYALLGRWIGHFRHRCFVHARIAAAAPIRGERPLGWLAHYAIGIGFAFLVLVIAGGEWAMSPTLPPALLVGVGSVVAPWFVMQPAFGAGLAGARTPNPAAGRLRNLGTHTVDGVGLYVSAVAISTI